MILFWDKKRNPIDHSIEGHRVAIQYIKDLQQFLLEAKRLSIYLLQSL